VSSASTSAWTLAGRVSATANKRIILTLLPLWPQPLIALLLATFTLVSLTVVGLTSRISGVDVASIVLAGVLAAAVAISYQFPIHVGRSHKVEMTSISLYLMAVLLPLPLLASAAAGFGILGGELLVRAKRGNLYSDVTTAVCRWMLIVLAGATFAHSFTIDNITGLVGTALILWMGDAITGPLVIAPMTDDPPLRVMVANFRASAVVEGTEYLLGMLGALAASVQVWALGLLVVPTILIYMALKSVKEVQSNTRQMLESLADTVDLRDPYTGGHSQRVAALTASIVRAIGMTGPEAELIVAAARVHDIGKIGVPDYILNKPDRLTPEEEAIMQTHPDLGADLLKRYHDFARGVEIIRHHHERWDGKGYPQKLRSTSIPFGARVIAVADSYDAMTSDRPYRKAMSVTTATSILREGRGKQWDARVVDAFLRSISTHPELEPAPPILTTSDLTNVTAPLQTPGVA